MNTTVYFHLPNGLPRNRELAEYGRELLTEALELRLKPASLPRMGRQRSSVSLSSRLAANAMARASELKMELPEACAALAKAADLRRHPKPAPDAVVRTRPTGLLSQRGRMKAEMLEGMSSAIRDGKIALQEGGTGIGKSRVIARGAWNYIQANPKQKVIIAAPTISVMSHLVSEWDKEGLDPSVCRLTFGRRQFVDVTSLSVELDALEKEGVKQTAEVREWIYQGGPVVSEASRRLSAIAPRLRWLADDLREVAPQFPQRDFLLDQNSPYSDATAAYEELRAAAAEGQVIFTSHAMLLVAKCLSRSIKGFAGLLPEAGLLLIDEAHVLEESLLSVMSGGVSFFQMRRVMRDLASWKKLRLGAAAEATLAALLPCAKIVEQTLPNDLILTPVQMQKGAHTAGWTRLAKAMKALVQAMAPFVQKARGRTSDNRLATVVEWSQRLSRAAAGHESVIIEHSPVRRFGTVTVGPLVVYREFEWMWKNTASASLLSGTLSIDGADGKPSYGYMRDKLAIPPARLLTCRPLSPAWNYQIPLMHMVGKDSAQALSYPGAVEDEAKDDGDEQLNRWWDSIAQRIAKIQRQAKGGTLVLCASYQDVHEVGSRLTGKIAANRLFLHTRGTTIQQLRGGFAAQAEAGKKPLWLACGAAWTGLDLMGQATDPAADFLLTDLVVTRLPFGFNRSSTHLARKHRVGFAVESLEVSLRLRQGFGRLIRREGVTDRQIWMLDGRLQPGRGAHYDRFTRICARYRQGALI